ncbi:MAG: hypothetical protein AAGD07_18150 [Planctomycetota bacterium]
MHPDSPWRLRWRVPRHAFGLIDSVVCLAVMATAGTLLVKTVMTQRSLDHTASLRLSHTLQVNSTAHRLRQMDRVRAEDWLTRFESEQLSVHFEKFEADNARGHFAVITSTDSPTATRRVWWLEGAE